MSKHDRIQLVISLLGLILVILAPSRDLVAFILLIPPFLLVTGLASFIYFQNKHDQEISYPRKLRYLIVIANVLLFLGLLFGQIQPASWLMFIPFGYYLILSTIVIVSLYISIISIISKS